MKKYLILLGLIFVFFVSNANHDSIKSDPVEETPAGRVNSKTGGNDVQFVFRIYPTASEPKGEVESHFLGDEIAEKWTLVNELYLRKGDISVGFSTSYTEVVKPSVFNAVCKMNSYYKKALSKGLLNREEAQTQFMWILDCALAAFASDETKNFESALMKAKAPEQINQIFRAVKIEKI